MNSLPLSWSYSSSNFKKSVKVNNWNIEWPAIQNISSKSFINITKYPCEEKNNIILRGCSEPIKNTLAESGFSFLHIGYEAEIDISRNPFNKKSLRTLVKRGNRFGKVIQIPYSVSNKSKLSDFQKVTSHGNEPQLKNLFQIEFNPNNFLFVFLDHNSKWLGAILLSKNSSIKLHTELLLRKKNIPIGIMESLIETTYLFAKNEGYKFLSLGEVPFSKYSKLSFRKADLIFILGNTLNFAYNHKGLYNFKNKFNPKWRKVYLCSSKKIGIKHLTFLLIYSNFHKLILYKLFYVLKQINDDFFDKLKKKMSLHYLTLIRPSCNFYPIK